MSRFDDENQIRPKECQLEDDIKCKELILEKYDDENTEFIEVKKVNRKRNKSILRIVSWTCSLLCVLISISLLINNNTLEDRLISKEQILVILLSITGIIITAVLSIVFSIFSMIMEEPNKRITMIPLINSSIIIVTVITVIFYVFF